MQGNRKMAFIASPYGSGDLYENLRIARAMCRLAAEEGYVPFAPHLFYTQFMDDHDETDRQEGMSSAGFFIDNCEAFYFYAPGLASSEGVMREFKRAEGVGRDKDPSGWAKRSPMLIPVTDEELVKYWGGFKAEWVRDEAH